MNNSIFVPLISSPLDQFAINCLIPFRLGPFDISFTNSSLFLLAGTGLVSILIWFATVKGGRLVPSIWQSIVEMTYDFIYDMVQNQVGPKGRPYFPFIFAIFVFILSANLIGMIPYSFTSTSHMVVTFGLSISIFVGVTLIGIMTHGLHFLSFFLPAGAPLALAPLLVVLEVVSYSFRAISLGVRLFANMMAGHTLVKILSGFAWTMLSVGGILAVGALGPFLVVFGLTGLELGVASLQAYVFTILTCIYLNDAIHLH